MAARIEGKAADDQLNVDPNWQLVSSLTHLVIMECKHLANNRTTEIEQINRPSSRVNE